MMQITKQIKANKIRAFTLILSLILISAFTLAACGGNDKADPGGPSAPQNFTVTAGDGLAILTWTAPSSKGDSDITKYEVSKDNGKTWVDADLDFMYIFADLTNSTKYTFKVRAVNGNGKGASTSKTATPKAGSSQPKSVYDYTKLPQNVEIRFTSAINNSVALYCTFIKKGNDFYSATNLTGFGETQRNYTEYFLKYNNGTWTEYYSSYSSDEWAVYGDTYNASTIGGRLEDSDYISMLIDLAVGATDGTNSGTEDVAGQQTTKYRTTGGGYTVTYWYHSATKLVLKYKTEGGSTNVETVVTLWNEAITGFGGLNLP